MTAQYPMERLAGLPPVGFPFASPEGIVAIVMAAALALIGVVAWTSLKAKPLNDPIWSARFALSLGCGGAIAVLWYAATFELPPDLRVIGWAVLGSLSFALAAVVHRDRAAWMVSAFEGSVILAIGALLLLGTVVPPTRLLVDPNHHRAILPLLNRDSLAMLALATSLVLAGWIASRWSFTRPFSRPGDPFAGSAYAGAGALLVYLCSIGIVDWFQARLALASDPRELATQAQVALSIAWVMIGAVAFAIGLVRRLSVARLFGLGLLAVATGKVFLFDLAALDVAYRVLSFIGLGGVLLATSFVADRFRSTGRPPSGADNPVGEHVADAPADL
jgi:hypothetical protein